jgi:S-DNA-T family DNA segregation ATPase FtsK/SpoIIIE
VPAEHQLGYAVAGAGLAGIIEEAAVSLRKRLPGPDIAPERLPLRDWWAGPRLFVLVDDYDLLASSGTNSPLDPLLELLPQGGDIGLHLVVARASSGAARAMMDRCLRRLWELGSPGLLLSCAREEGSFLGDTRPMQLPPGRAQLVTRRSSTLVQTALVPPSTQ